MIAYGRLDNFSGGVALASSFAQGCAHDWTQFDARMELESGTTLKFWRAACGYEAVSSKTWPMLDRGTFPICKRCAKKMERAA